MRKQDVQRLAAILCIAYSAIAQQRIPGRVGGSPNYWEVSRARQTSVTFLSTDPAFADAKSVYPDLEPEGFRRIQNFVQNLKTTYGVDATVRQVLEKLREKAGNPKPAFKAVLAEAKIDTHDKKARQLVDDSLK
jgi:hypothetical protein